MALVATKDKRMIHIAITLNEDYILPACVMLTSLFENNKNNEIHIHVLTDTNSIKLNLLKRTISKYSGTYTFYYLDENFIKNIENFKITAHADYANYFRIFIPDLLNNKIEKVLYLDVDMIICDDLSPLYNKNITEYAIAAIDEYNETYNITLNIPKEYSYFNSGVLLMNLTYFRQNDLVKKLITYIIENEEKIINWDQDAFNAVLYNKCLSIEHQWNITYKIALKNKDIQPKIVHYTGMHKAWHLDYCEHPYKQLYFDYLKKDFVLKFLNKYLTPKSHR